jgi:hypothetical protein
MSKNSTDKRQCPFCGKICYSGTKGGSICTTLVSTLIVSHNEAFLALYEGKLQNDNKHAHVKCAYNLTRWKKPINPIQNGEEPHLQVLKDQKPIQYVQNIDVKLTNHNNSVVIGIDWWIW